MQLHGAGYRKLFRNAFYGDKPSGPRTCPATTARARSSTCSPACATAPRGRIGIEDKGTPGTQEQGLYPWFEVPGRVERDLELVCGHWSALGLTITQGVHAIDTGAVWGGKLTASWIPTSCAWCRSRAAMYRHQCPLPAHPRATGASAPALRRRARNRAAATPVQTPAAVARADVAAVAAVGAARVAAPTTVSAAGVTCSAAGHQGRCC